jgi:hypothetical protein
MENPLGNLKSVADGEGDVMKKIDEAHGEYKDSVSDNTNTMSKLPQTSLPTGTDPSPFTLGPLGGGKQ